MISLPLTTMMIIARTDYVLATSNTECFKVLVPFHLARGTANLSKVMQLESGYAVLAMRGLGSGLESS